MSKNSGGEVTYEIVADDSQLESDLNEAGKKVEKSAKKTAKKSEDAEKESAEVKKSVKEDVTKKNEQENDKQEKDDDDSYQNREESAKSHGSKLSSIASGTAKAIGAGMLAAGTVIAGVSVAAVKSANTTVDTLAELEEEGRDKFDELKNYKQLKISVDDTDLELGDIVGGRERITNIYMAAPVIRKIVDVTGRGRTSISYKLKGEE